MEKLRKLNLSIPALDSIECKSLMGGDGYYQGSTPENAIPLPLFEKVYDDGEPDHDYPTDDGYYEDDKSYLEDERTGDHDNDNDLENNSDASHDFEHDCQFYCFSLNFSLRTLNIHFISHFRPSFKEKECPNLRLSKNTILCFTNLILL